MESTLHGAGLLLNEIRVVKFGVLDGLANSAVKGGEIIALIGFTFGNSDLFITNSRYPFDQYSCC